MPGTITSLGLGSSIDPQGTLDSLREIGEEVITEKEDKSLLNSEADHLIKLLGLLTYLA